MNSKQTNQTNDFFGSHSDLHSSHLRSLNLQQPRGPLYGMYYGDISNHDRRYEFATSWSHRIIRNFIRITVW